MAKSDRMSALMDNDPVAKVNSKGVDKITKEAENIKQNELEVSKEVQPEYNSTGAAPTIDPEPVSRKSKKIKKDKTVIGQNDEYKTVKVPETLHDELKVFLTINYRNLNLTLQDCIAMAIKEKLEKLKGKISQGS